MKNKVLPFFLMVFTFFSIAAKALGAELSSAQINDLARGGSPMLHKDASFWNSPFAGEIIVPLFVVIFYFANWVYGRTSEETKRIFLRRMFIYSPICFVIIILFLLSGSVSNPLSDIIVFLSFLVVAIVYFFLAISPYGSAYAVMQIIKEMFGSEKAGSSTFWSLLDRIKSRRFWIFSVLGLFFVILISLNMILALEFIKNHSESGNLPLPLIVFFGFMSVIFYLAMEIFRYGRVEIPASEHKKSIDIRRSIENISITAGITAPDFAIIAHNSPNAFSVCPNLKKPTIYITTGLLNLMDRNELEAIIAHEIAFISSGRIFDYRNLNNVLSLLKMLSYLFFILMFAVFDPFLAVIVFGVVVYVSIRFVKVYGEGMGVKHFFDMVISLFNPPYLFVNFVSCLIYYRLSYDEEFYADLKAVQFTRYPKALYSALSKLKEHKGLNIEKLPEEFYYLYFSEEGMIPDYIPMPQPSIEERKAVLSEIDETLQNLTVKEEAIGLECPVCGRNMEELEGRGHYGMPLKLDHCLKCNIVWFDNWELWYMADLASFGKNKEFFGEANYLIKKTCPRCGIELSEMIDRNIPPGVKIWTCPGCEGNLLDNRSLSKYLQYKKQLVQASEN